jgi:hypothetical protein
MSRLRRHAAALGVLVIGVLLAAGATAAAPAAPTIDSHPPEVSASGDADFTFSYGSSVNFQCRLVGSDFSNCGESVDKSSKNYSGLEDGPHTFEVTAIHDDDEPSDPASWTWEIDRKPPPAPTIDLKPSDPSNDRAPAFRFSDSEQNVTFECRLDSADFSDCSSPKIYNIPAGDAEGTHTFRVRAVDKAKNRSGVRRYTWRIDLKPPPAPSISSAPTNPTTATNATFAFADTESPVGFRCQFDGGGFSSCASPVAYSGLSTIPHVFSVQATDTAGNTGATTSYAWTIVATHDTTAPGEVTRLRRSIGYRILKLEWARPADPDFDYVRILVGKGSKAAKGQLRTSVYKGIGTHYTNKRLQNGTYYRYSIVSYDKAGNASKGMTVVVKPSVLLRSPRNGAAVHAPPRLAWAKVAHATFYNVQLFFRGRKVLSAWPSAAKLGLKQRWSYADRRFKLKLGTYHWFVWPAFGTRAKSRYGQLIGQSGFTVR